MSESAPTAYEWLNDAVKRLMADNDRLTARAERAEAQQDSLARQLIAEEADNARNGEARNRAEAAVKAVRELANRWSFIDDESVTVDELRDQVLAALDAQRPAEGGTDPAAKAERLAAIAMQTGHTVGCTCSRCQPDTPAPTGEETP